VKLRALLLALASLGIPLALATIALPMTWGYGGFSLSPAANGVFHVAYVTPDSPAARAGLHRGDVVRPLKGWDEIRELGGSASTTITLRVVRDGHVTPTNVTFVPFYGPLAVQETIRKIAGSLTAIVAFGVVIPVLLRARDIRLGTRAATARLALGRIAIAQHQRRARCRRCAGGARTQQPRAVHLRSVRPLGGHVAVGHISADPLSQMK
jgi:hypothetical protein